MNPTKGNKGGAKAWSEAEQRAAVRAYNVMLMLEVDGKPYSKAAVNRWLRGVATVKDWKQPATMTLAPERGAVATRSHGSLEMKFCNISAARRALRWPTIRGYKSFGQGQKSLTDIIKE